MSQKIVPSPLYPTIQSAIDDSLAGDTILVLPGEYREDLVIDKSQIILKGYYPVGTILEGAIKDATGITVIGAQVCISNLTLKNYYIGVALLGDSCCIDSCSILHCKAFGVLLSANKCTLSNLACESNYLFGLNIAGDCNTLTNITCTKNILGGITNSQGPLTNSAIVNSNITFSQIAISLVYTQSTNNVIENNAFTCDTGIHLVSPNNTLKNNIFQNCATTAIIVQSEDNKLTQNSIFSSSNGVIVSSSDNTLLKLKVHGCSDSCVTLLDSNNSVADSVFSHSHIGILSMSITNALINNLFSEVEIDVVNT